MITLSESDFFVMHIYTPIQLYKLPIQPHLHYQTDETNTHTNYILNKPRKINIYIDKPVDHSRYHI